MSDNENKDNAEQEVNASGVTETDSGVTETADSLAENADQIPDDNDGMLDDEAGESETEHETSTSEESLEAEAVDSAEALDTSEAPIPEGDAAEDDVAAASEDVNAEDPAGENVGDQSEAELHSSEDVEQRSEPVIIPNLPQIIEGAVLAADKPLSIDHIIQLFPDAEPSRAQVREAIEEIQAQCEGRGFELKQVASGYRFQVRIEYGDWIGRLWDEKPPRYTRALLETLALIAYKQPITRGDIEDIRGVSVSTNIIRTLLEREWIRVVGHRDVPGRPSIYATTKTFLDYFDLTSLDELPTLSEIKDLDKVNAELDLEGELIEPRSLSLSQDDENTEGSGADEESLDDVTDKVNQISENIKNLFKEPEEDELEDLDDDPEVAEQDDATETLPQDSDAEPAQSSEQESEQALDQELDQESDQEASEGSIEATDDELGSGDQEIIADPHDQDLPASDSSEDDPNRET